MVAFDDSAFYFLAKLDKSVCTNFDSQKQRDNITMWKIAS